MMLTICTDTLPQNCLSYLAFRLACVETLKFCEFSRHLPGEFREPFGFLTEVPFLREVAPHVQIALLAETWRKHISTDVHKANLVDEGIVYAVCETAARLVENLPEVVGPYVETGPLDVRFPVDHLLASELRSLHLQLSNEGDFLLISQLQDLPPEEADEFKEQFHLNDAYLAPMFEALGLWHVNIGQLVPKLTGLLTERELQELPQVLGLSTAPVDR